jgi:hypothetical protein
MPASGAWQENGSREARLCSPRCFDCLVPAGRWKLAGHELLDICSGHARNRIQRFVRVPDRMRRQNDVGQTPERVIFRKRFNLEYIERGSADLT